jgi:type IV pilus assembly protein PilB
MAINQLEHIHLSVELQQSISSDIANHFLIVPKHVSNSEVIFYIDQLKESEMGAIKEELKLILDKTIQLELIDTSILKKTLSIYYRKNEAAPKLVSYGNDFL